MQEEIRAKLAKMEGVTVEENGSWLWASGDTRPHKEELKELGLRWSKKRSAWYWKPAAGSAEAKAAAPEEIDLEAIAAEYSGEHSDGYMGATRWDGNHSKTFLYGSELSKAIRGEFKKCGIKNTTVSCHTYSGGQSVSVKIKVQPEDFKTAEYLAEAKDYGLRINQYWLEKYDDILSEHVMKKIKAVKAIVDSYNYDDSNAMVDYFNRGFYEDYYVKVA